MEIPYTVQPREDTGLFNAKVGIWLFLASEVMLFGALFSAYILLRVGAPAGHWPEVATAWPHGLLNIPIGTFNTFVLISSSITVVMAWASLKMNRFDKFKLYQGLTVLCALTFIGVKSYEYRDKFLHYEVRLKSGAVVTGHIEGNPYFLNLSKMNDPKHPVTSITVHPDESHGAAKAKAGEAVEKGEAAGAAEKHEGHPAPMVIQRDDIKSLRDYIPRHSAFFAIYFTLTGLHALHVFGGMLVMGYFWGPGSKMWKTEPERFTNRIEVSGLFWHFVDLVWIFLFPVLYLL